MITVFMALALYLKALASEIFQFCSLSKKNLPTWSVFVWHQMAELSSFVCSLLAAVAGPNVQNEVLASGHYPMKEGRKPEYPEKTPDDELQKMPNTKA